MSDFDVLIIGAGAAGLMCARELSRRGAKVSIIEARERIGGRISTFRHESVTVPLELGAEFVHGEPKTLCAVLKEYKLSRTAIEGKRVQWSLEHGFGEQYLFNELEAVLEELGRCNEDVSFDEFLDRNARWSAETKQAAKRFIQGYNCATTAEISAKALSHEHSEDDESVFINHRILSGYSSLVECLAKDCRKNGVVITCGSPVDHIRWQPGSVVASGGAFSVSAKKIVITVPLPLLVGGKITFDPPIPEKIRTAKAIGMGRVIKCIAIFDRNWWKECQAVRDIQFLNAQEEAIPTWWTIEPKSEPVLVGWAGGPNADYLGTLPKEHLHQIIISNLERMFSIESAQTPNIIRDIRIINWQSEIFSAGSYSYQKAGHLSAKSKLAEPIENTLFFAGEATIGNDETGTVEAALLSGVQVALDKRITHSF